MKNLLLIRYVYIIAVIFTLINSIFFLISGVIESVHGFQIFFRKLVTGEKILIGIYFMEALDRFLIAFVFMIFSLGIYKLFFVKEQHIENLPSWLQIDNFKELKVLLWETIMVTLVVFTISMIVNTTAVKGITISSLGWNALVLPSIILILSLSLFFMRKG
ncbi:YqhA family protein [Adhaeribacter sp. BT258]|uniref:YqhA family protein n=1 Tax=Adhaeribacter terrigena TaxID=2793070 RepID=A0ABS1C5N3_9BACT|nr:YqhA family protein [Adhaeribacter terrigena]MBK0404679.1 YqhA family protein [Adhaeribacter terrigena]